MRPLRAVAAVVLMVAVTAGCGTPLDSAEDAYSIEESTARKSYIIVATAAAKGTATEEQLTEARRLYDAYFQSQTQVYDTLAAARAEGDVNLLGPGRREAVARHMVEVTRNAFLLVKLAKEVTK